MCALEKQQKPSDSCLNHHLFQGPDLEVLSDVSTGGGVSVGNAECVCVSVFCVSVKKTSVQTYLQYKNSEFLFTVEQFRLHQG